MDKHDTDELTRNGAQLIPIRSKDDQILYHHEGGVKYGTSKIGKGLIYAIRHNEGNYEDSIDDMEHSC